MEGRVHSVETFGTVDGPGIRFVLFLQGCSMRCAYCHNPDTWDLEAGETKTVDEVLAEVSRMIPYITRSGGGITVSGGEPMMQAEFVTELFRACKSQGIHTALDTSGYPYTYTQHRVLCDALLDQTDLVLLDLKHMDANQHAWLTERSSQGILQFAQHLSEKNIPMWIRHVLVPGVTDGPGNLEALGTFVRSLNSVERVEILPYHELGVHKWPALGMDYRLQNIKPPTEDDIRRAYQRLGVGILDGPEDGCGPDAP